MPAPPLYNTYRGGTPGTAISVGNSGGASGDAWSNVTTGLNCTNTYEIDPLSGELVCHMVMPATAAATHNDWTGLGSLTVPVFCSFYLLKTATPPANWFYPMVAQNNAAARCCGVVITTGNLLRFDNAAGTSVLTSTMIVPNNQWVRIETKITPSTTVGVTEYRLYLEADAPKDNFDETKTVTAQVLAANIDQVLYGLTTTVTNMNGQHWYFKNAGVSTLDWVGPAGTSKEFRPKRMSMGV